jgi:hypothetical protein
MTKTNKRNLIKKTPLEKSIDDAHRKELKTKLRNAILIKRQMRLTPSKKVLSEQADKLKNIMNHPKMNQQILEAYMAALGYNPKVQLPSPVEIFDNIEHHKIEYYQYILSLVKIMKEKNIPLSRLDKLLDNPYAKYMSLCIGCLLNPFNKSHQLKQSQETNIDQSI